MMEKAGEVIGNNKRMIVVAVILIIIGIVTILLYRGYVATHIATDDAFVEGNVHTIASKVAGTVRSIQVGDNQFVKKGQLLVELDDVDYTYRTEEAQAGVQAETMRFHENQNKLDTVQRQVREVEASIAAARANVALQEANLAQARMDYARYEGLYKRDAVSKERYERTGTGLLAAEAQLTAAVERFRQMEASLETQHAVFRQTQTALSTQKAVIQTREAQLEGAELSVSYTRITAPVDGYVTKKAVQVGNQVSPGMPLLAVVSLDDIWIVANYKETQLTHVRHGQKVTIRVDAYPGRRFKGAVDSIMAGTGSTFSLFPAENATGNFVKVVQRIPVKITLDKDANNDHLLRVGMSVVPTILVE
jgi:membrane fusion protein (multidrug efflux system)